jgi:hypothetical protein
MINDLVQNGPAAGMKPTGKAAIYFRVGDEAPVEIRTPFFQLGNDPKSLVLWFFDSSIRPVRFLLYISIQNIYLGPGEYKGNASDIQVGLGIPSVTGGESPTWTAGENTASDMTTYFVSGGSALIGSLTVQGLVPGPVMGPPDNPPPDLPTADILFCFFDSQATGSEGNG